MRSSTVQTTTEKEKQSRELFSQENLHLIYRYVNSYVRNRQEAQGQYRLDKENDTLEALDGLWPVVASRVREQHDDLSERTLQFRHLPVLRAGARKFRASFFADSWVAAQATKRQQRLAQIPEQALGQVLVLERAGLLEFMDGIRDQ